MVKPKQPASQPANPAAVGTHPFADQPSSAAQAQTRLDNRDKWKAFKAAEADKWRLGINSMAASEHGRMLLRAMLDESGILKPPNLGNAQSLITNQIKGAFYLTWVRPFLELKVRQELEA